ncbi:hypothetical protein [Streptomyces lydicus]
MLTFHPSGVRDMVIRVGPVRPGQLGIVVPAAERAVTAGAACTQDERTA